MEKIYLSRRNLLTLLSKLDRKKNEESTACTLIKNKNDIDPFVQTIDQIAVTAVEDSEYYIAREAGQVHPADDPTMI
jgi:hypothetical protein